jgi:hypothetical protein
MAKKSKDGEDNETPLMRQYNQIKAKYPGALLLFRVGDFYETFGQDAVTASEFQELYSPKEPMVLPLTSNWLDFHIIPSWILICLNW